MSQLRTQERSLGQRDARDLECWSCSVQLHIQTIFHFGEGSEVEYVLPIGICGKGLSETPVGDTTQMMQGHKVLAWQAHKKQTRT